jgi:glutathione synthase/RimK-type ligase-like ATP-grasp enzyme
VVKPNNGTGGDLVFKVSTINELNKAINLIFSRFDALAISPYYKIVQEYRLIVLNNEVQLLYLKQRKHNE